jgi:hypothetical protein
MIADDSLNSTHLRPIKSSALLQPDGIKPEFCHLILALDMNMRRFVSVTGVKEETVGTHSEYGGHLFFNAVHDFHRLSIRAHRRLN